MNFPSLEKRLEICIRPNQSTVLFQNWRKLAFIHWMYPAELIQDLLPKGLFVDTFENKAYVGIVPFFMRDVHPRFFPFASNFCEMNVRTYVYNEKGEPGVWFFSLDANHWLTVKIANLFYSLPYIYSTFTIRDSFFECARKEKAATQFSYKAGASLGFAEPNTLAFFVVERYQLFSVNACGKLCKARIHHKPYFLRELILNKWDENALDWNNLPKVERAPDHLLYSEGVDVETFRLQFN